MGRAARFPAALDLDPLVENGAAPLLLPWGARKVPAASTGAAGPSSVPRGSPLLRQALILGAIAALALPAATPAAGVARLSFPAGAALIAGWLAARGRLNAYVTFCLWLFLLTPFVRRLADAHAGYVQGSTLM